MNSHHIPRRAALACALALAAVTLFAGSAWADNASCMVEVEASADVPAKLETLAGRPTIRHIPAKPKGVVYLFHGTGGSETFATRLHSRRVLARLVAAGYGYVSAPSLDRTKVVRWDTSSADPAINLDIAYMLGLHKALIAKGEITALTPVFTMGMSNGGAFANLYASAAKAQGLPVVAVAAYMGSFPASMRNALPDPHSLPPTLLLLSKNDGLVSAERTAAVAAELIGTGAPIEVHVSQERKLCAASFALVPDLSEAQRVELVASTLPQAGIIDTKGARQLYLDHPVITREDMVALAAKLPATKQGRAIMDEILIAWGGHMMRSDYGQRQVEFFDAALGRRR